MSTYTPSLGLEEITPGTQAGLWGNTTNNNLALIDQAVTGVTPIDFTGASGTTQTLTLIDGSIASTARSAVLNITGTALGSNTLIVPNKQKMYLVRNNTGQNVVFRTSSPSATYTVEAGNSILIFCDGNNNVFTGIAAPSVGTLSVSAGGTGATTFTAGFVKSTGGTNALTSSATVDLSSEVSGTLLVARGGTGQTSFTSGTILSGNGTGAIGSIAVGASNQAIVSNGSSYAPANIVNSITAGSGVTVSGSTGNITISASGVSAPVSSVFGRTGAITAQSTDYSSFYPLLSGTNNFTGTNNFSSSASINSSGSSAGDVRISVVGGGLTSGLSGIGVQIGQPGWGLNYTTTPALSVVQGGGFSTDFRSTGNFQSNNSPNWATTSDINIKTNLRPINGALSKLCSLQPKHFEYKDEIGKTRTGFIAQEFETVFPGHTLETEVSEQYKKFMPEGVDKLKALDLNLVPYLVKAIQELKAELDAAKAEIAALKAK